MSSGMAFIFAWSSSITPCALLNSLVRLSTASDSEESSAVRFACCALNLVHLHTPVSSPQACTRQTSVTGDTGAYRHAPVPKACN